VPSWLQYATCFQLCSDTASSRCLHLVKSRKVLVRELDLHQSTLSLMARTAHLKVTCMW
jgi:hypothetical protein